MQHRSGKVPEDAREYMRGDTWVGQGLQRCEGLVCYKCRRDKVGCRLGGDTEPSDLGHSLPASPLISEEASRESCKWQSCHHGMLQPFVNVYQLPTIQVLITACWGGQNSEDWL